MRTVSEGYLPVSVFPFVNTCPSHPFPCRTFIRLEDRKSWNFIFSRKYITLVSFACVTFVWWALLNSYLSKYGRRILIQGHVSHNAAVHDNCDISLQIASKTRTGRLVVKEAYSNLTDNTLARAIAIALQYFLSEFYSRHSWIIGSKTGVVSSELSRGTQGNVTQFSHYH